MQHLSSDRSPDFFVCRKYEVIPLLLDLARATVKEKLLRVCLASWRNFLENARESSISVMIGAKVLDFIEHLCSRKISDEEMSGDLLFLKNELVTAYQSLKYTVIPRNIYMCKTFLVLLMNMLLKSDRGSQFGPHPIDPVCFGRKTLLDLKKTNASY